MGWDGAFFSRSTFAVDAGRTFTVLFLRLRSSHRQSWMQHCLATSQPDANSLTDEICQSATFFIGKHSKIYLQIAPQNLIWRMASKMMNVTVSKLRAECQWGSTNRMCKLPVLIWKKTHTESQMCCCFNVYRQDLQRVQLGLAQKKEWDEAKLILDLPRDCAL